MFGWFVFILGVLGWCCYAAVLVFVMVCKWSVLCLFLRSDAVCHDSYSTQLPCAATRTQAVPISSTVPDTSTEKPRAT